MDRESPDRRQTAGAAGSREQLDSPERSGSQRRRCGWLRWFSPWGHSVGRWAFALNRFSGLLLAVYLFVHLAVLSLLRSTDGSYDRFVEAMSAPVFLILDTLLVAVAIGHGFNGIRLIIVGLGIASDRQREILALLMAVAVIVFGYAAWRIVTA